MNEQQKQRLAEIRERESKATKGPWHLHFYNVPGDPVYAIEDGDGDGGELAQFWGGTDPEEWPAEANAEFTAHARQDIPLLLTLLDQAQRDTDRVDWLERNPHPDFSQVGNDVGWTVRHAIDQAMKQGVSNV